MDADKESKAVTGQEVPLHPRLSERVEADRLAKHLLDDQSADSDDDLRMLARQLLRRNEVIDRLVKELYARQDPTLDLINANRDSILKVHEEGMRRIRKVLSSNAPDRIGVVYSILNAVNSFHPMHGESWCGWPKESEG